MHLHMLYSIETLSLVRALTIEKDPSQWSFVFSEKNKKTGYKKNHKNTPELVSMAGLFACTIYYYYTMLFKLLPYGLPYRH